jgi:hypothetical protein
MLADSLAEVVEVVDLAMLVRHMCRSVESWYPPKELPTIETTRVEPYGYDTRIGWDTHIVLVNGSAWGFTDGPLPSEPRASQVSREYQGS